MKTYYQLLGIASTASLDEVKSAFRREIARYHPDKVHHLGAEFQEMASNRAAELTEAYRILMDPAGRAAYDTALTDGTAATAGAPSSPSPAAAAPAAAAQAPQEARAKPAGAPQPVPETLRETRASVSVFVRKATINRIRDIVAALSGAAEPSADGGFDAVFMLQGKKGFFQKAEPPVRVAIKVVDQVDAAAIDAAWPLALRLRPDAMPCVLLCGTGMAASRELAGAIAEQRRKNRQTAPPIVIPVDTRVWEALIPPDTPTPVRKLIERLKLGV